MQALSGCYVAKKIAGADIDPKRFAKAREAKMLEIRSLESENLVRRLSGKDALDNADVTCFLSEDFLNRVASGYVNTNGWLDANTSYIIKKVALNIKNGSAIATLAILANSNKYTVDVDLTMDCIMTFQVAGNDLVLKLEPFNISPAVSAKGLYSYASDIIQNLISINLANIGNTMPKIKIPLNIENKMNIPGSRTNISNKINLLIANPERFINFKLVIKEVLFFEKTTFVALNLQKVEVK